MSANPGLISGMPNNEEGVMPRVKSQFLSAYLIMSEIVKLLIDEVKNLNGSDEDLRRIKTDPELRRHIAELIVGRKGEEASEATGMAKHLDPWIKFYRDVLNVAVNLDTFRIPEHVPGFDRLIVVLPGMTPEKLFQLCRSRFRGWKWTDKSLDEIVTSVRTAASGPYVIWVRDREEADDELAGKSYNDLVAAGIVGVTLEERLLDELEFHYRTNRHKDRTNVTLCSGSRCSAGRVPGVYWLGSDDKLRVDWFGPDDRGDDLRSRQAVA